jgi:DNA-binding transcriptional MerR regulator
LEEIKEIVAIKRSGQLPCSHVRQLVRRKVADLDRTVRNLIAARNALRSLLTSWSRRRAGIAAVCPYIERGERRG